MVMPSFARRRRRNRMVSMITPRRELSVPHETLTAPREKMIVPREPLIRLLVDATVLLPKRNSTKVGCNPTARWCECHRVVDHRHRAVDQRHGDGTNRHRADHRSAHSRREAPPRFIECSGPGYSSATQRHSTLRPSHLVQVVARSHTPIGACVPKLSARSPR